MLHNIETEHIEQKIIITLLDDGSGKGSLELTFDPEIIPDTDGSLKVVQRVATQIAHLFKSMLDNPPIQDLEIEEDEKTVH